MQIAHEQLSDTDTDDFIATLQVIKNIERVGDLTMNLNEFYELAYDDKGLFSKHAISDVNEMYETVLEMNKLALSYFKEHSEADLKELLDKENYLDLVEEKARQRHFKRMAANECTSSVAAGVYVDILGTLERIGDHIFNIVKEVDSDTHLYEQEITQKIMEQGL